MDTLYAIHVKSTDAVASAGWYVKYLNGQLIQTQTKANGDLTVRVDIGGILVNFTQHPNAAELPRAPEGEHIGLEHFGLIVDNLAETVSGLQAAGVEVLVPITSGPDIRPGRDVKWAFVRGPDGIRQELVEIISPVAKA
jgi:lactoylglutathione lyase